MYGDAIWETSSQAGGNYSWNGDRSDEDTSNGDPFFLRGGGYSYGSKSGNFAFSDSKANTQIHCSTRAVLAVD